MLKAASNVNSNPNSPLAIAFKPRQVLLAEHRTKITAMSKKNHTKTQTLTQQQKTRLLYSVIKFIENNAFSKTLKRILSEAQIEGDEWKSVPLDLEDLYCNYLDICNRDETTANTIEKQDLRTEGTTKVDTNSHCVVSKEPLKKEKKKKRSESEQRGAAVQSEAILIKVSDATKNSKVSDARTNGKKKGKNGSDYSDESKETQSLANTVSVENGELTDKSKEKKEKKKKSKNVNQEDIDTVRVEVEEQSKDLASAARDVKKEKKSSKKRKRLVSDDNEIQSDDNETSKECKWKKAKGSEKSEKNDKSKESEKENSQDEKGELTFTNKAQLSHADENHENGGDRSASKKSAKKQHNGSAEPKTVNAFQRVKIDEVEFADEKLQDNSYWAKSGAEIGYGAKAQEVLGQVRGRDFRHEKTKKKRGSYRGGLIDLQSHSVKFNYSDED